MGNIAVHCLDICVIFVGVFSRNSYHARFCCKTPHSSTDARVGGSRVEERRTPMEHCTIKHSAPHKGCIHTQRHAQVNATLQRLSLAKPAGVPGAVPLERREASLADPLDLCIASCRGWSPARKRAIAKWLVIMLDNRDKNSSNAERRKHLRIHARSHRRWSWQKRIFWRLAEALK